MNVQQRGQMEKKETKKENTGNDEEKEVQGEERDCPKIIASRHVRQNDPSFVASKYILYYRSRHTTL